MDVNKKNNKYFIFDRPAPAGAKAVLKKLLSYIKSIAWNVFLLGKKEIVQKKYRVSVCAIFKNEAPYLKEWITYHKIVGVDHLYLYNNHSDDRFLEVLKPYLEEGFVTLTEWPYQQAQMEAYKDCIRRFKDETMWIGFIDIDEFIVPKSTDTIYSFLKPFERKYGAVIIYWRLFGTSGHVERSLDGLVTEDFTVCWPKYCDIGKSFYNTGFAFDADSEKNALLHHRFWARKYGLDIPPVNIFGKVCIADTNRASCPDFPIQINHYFTKSYQEYAMKRAKGDVFFQDNPHDEAYFYHHEMQCTVTDYSAYKYLIKLKLAMKEGLHNE